MPGIPPPSIKNLSYHSVQNAIYIEERIFIEIKWLEKQCQFHRALWLINEAFSDGKAVIINARN